MSFSALHVTVYIPVSGVKEQVCYFIAFWLGYIFVWGHHGYIINKSNNPNAEWKSVLQLDIVDYPCMHMYIRELLIVQL